MTGTNVQRVARLGWHLATHPRHLSPYLFHGPLAGRTPLSLGLPWISFAAIEFLKGFLHERMDVFEYGAGGSTIFFAERVATVTSTEDEGKWVEAVKIELDRRELHNVTLRHCPFDFHAAVDFTRSDYLHSLPEKMFDLILIDGKEEGVPVRPICFRHAEARVRPGGVIVVDDSWRYPELRTTHRALRFREFRSPGPCRAGVTSTDIFFY